ncbi:hypothetical protein GF386_04960 [Candidatus Pacearchaeota archaeon]|nr:hypothetical protein [Candidatus Pacearchaeota archaeon]MBD3283463.1 hypothetical protein [Candidatus Pacearchaeota archaeon]
MPTEQLLIIPVIILAISFIFLILTIPLLLILGFIFWIFMIVDCANRKFRDENEKIAWIMIIVLANIIGAIIYYFLVKKPDRK